MPAHRFVETHGSNETGTTLGLVSSSIGAPQPTNPSLPVTGVSDDSRLVEPGDLYLALPGSLVHGLDFEHEARARGAVAIVSDRPGTHLPTIVVDDPRSTAGPISAYVHGHPSRALDLYGVTGTNGKTSTTYLLGAGLTAAGETAGTITGIAATTPSKSIPALRTTPEAPALQRTLAGFRRDGVTAAAMEVSSHAVSQRRIDATQFTVMGFTNLGPDHLDFHGTMERYFEAKAAMFDSVRTESAAIGIDGDYGRRLSNITDVPHWTWSTTDRSADVYGDNLRCDGEGTTFTAHTPVGRVDVSLRLLGPHQASNALTALTMLAINGIDLHAAAAGIAAVQAIPGRLEKIDAGQPFLALVDYMHNTTGQQRLIPYLRTLTAGRVIIVIGATGDRDASKRFPLGATAASLADLVIVTDESPYSENPDIIRASVAAGAVAEGSAAVVIEPDRRRAFRHAVDAAAAGDVVVVTGRGSDNNQVYGHVTTTFDERAELLSALTDRPR